jgi:rubrerythrin
MLEQEERQTRFRKLEEVTQKHLLRWQCPRCGYVMEYPVLRNTTTPLTCQARTCHQRFQIKEEEVFVAEPL